MAFQMPQLATAVGRPPMTGGVSAPNPAATPQLAAPSVNTARVGRPPMPAGGMPPGGGIMKPPMAGGARPRSFAMKLGGGPGMAKPTPAGAAGAVGGWNAAPEIVNNAVKMLKAGAELGPQHRAPLASLLANTDRPNPGPFAPAGGGFASKFGGVAR